MKSYELSLLVVDDEEDVRKLMKELLTENVKKLYLAKNGTEALDMLGSYQIDVVITDIEMPDMNGLELSKHIRKLDSHLPIIAFSAYDSVHYLKEGYRSGINIYHTKPLDSIDIILEDCLKLRASYQEINVKNEELRRLTDENDKLELEVIQDPMTGLFNRKGIIDYFKSILSASTRSSLPVAIVMADIDDFKIINDTCGHNTGDSVICSIASVFKQCTRDSDIVGRWGGEEFILLLQFADEKTTIGLLERIQACIEKDLHVEKCNVTASFGYTIFNPSLFSVEHLNYTDLIHEADQALYKAKQQGKNCTVGYDKNISGSLVGLDYA